MAVQTWHQKHTAYETVRGGTNDVVLRVCESCRHGAALEGIATVRVMQALAGNAFLSSSRASFTGGSSSSTLAPPSGGSSITPALLSSPASAMLGPPVPSPSTPSQQGAHADISSSTSNAHSSSSNSNIGTGSGNGISGVGAGAPGGSVVAGGVGVSGSSSLTRQRGETAARGVCCSRVCARHLRQAAA